MVRVPTGAPACGGRGVSAAELTKAERRGCGVGEREGKTRAILGYGDVARATARIWKKPTSIGGEGENRGAPPCFIRQ